MNPTRKWSGRAVTEARAVVAGWLPRPCGQCTEPVDGSTPWVIGHIKSRAEHPELTWDMSNWQVEHRACSNKSAQGVVIAKAKSDALREAGVFPTTPGPGQPPPLPVSPSEPLSQPALSGLVLPFPTGTPLTPDGARPDLAWNPERVRSIAWMADLAAVPEDASPPLYMTYPPEESVCSYGWSGCTHVPPEDVAEGWVERVERKSLRWWQRLGIRLQLQHREDGSLTAREYVESAPRRAGKSVRMRGMSLWRMAVGRRLFGEVQLVMHTGSDMAICREVQRGAWRWAESTWGKGTVTQANGKESIETPDGDRWLVRSQDGVYGYDVNLANVDEAWDVKPETVTEGLEPATLERVSPQVASTSTAHRRATSLMRGKISNALAVYDPEVVLLVWAAPPGSDPAKVETWRAASPHWSEDRRKLIARKYEAALAGQADPQADDPDPMAGFTSQYLNVWRLKERRAQRGEHITDAETWETLEDDKPAGKPTSAALESWFAAGVSIALAWRSGSRVVVSVSDHPNLEAAAAHLRAEGVRRVTVGASMLEHPALKGFTKRKGEGRTAVVVGQLVDLLREDVLRHDGGEHLAGQVTEVRTTEGPDGPRLVGSARADGIKAAVWAVRAAQGAQSGSMKILLPTGIA